MVHSGQMRVDMGVPGMLRGITGRSRVNMGTQHGQRRRRGSCVVSRVIQDYLSEGTSRQYRPIGII